MKKTALILMTLIAGAGLFAEDSKTRVRLSGMMDWIEESESATMGGVRLEVIGNKVGIGLEAMGDGDRENEMEDSGPGSAQWQGEIFLSYHIFGNNTLFDPYLQAGAGSAGYVTWNDSEEPDSLAMSLFPSLSAGWNLVFEEGLILGMRHSYHPENNFVPNTDYPVTDLPVHQTTFQVGFQFGGRDKKERKYEDDKWKRGCWKWCWCDDSDEDSRDK